MRTPSGLWAVTQYEAKCETCGVHDGLWHSETAANASAFRHGWLEREGSWYCPVCRRPRATVVVSGCGYASLARMKELAAAVDLSLVCEPLPGKTVMHFRGPDPRAKPEFKAAFEDFLGSFGEPVIAVGEDHE
jgi:hypothetical protein